MRAIPTIAAALALATAPLAAQTRDDEEAAAVTAAVDAFFEALRSPDKTALARTMDPRGTIFVHDRRDPAAPKIATRATADHLAGWEKSPPGTDEYMRYDTVLIDGDMAQVWGPYVFLVDGKPLHCGINSMSLARLAEGWRITNTSFTMTALDECEALGAPEVPAE
jgi:hypothetical protein